MVYLMYVGIIVFTVMQSTSSKFYNRTSGDAIMFNLLKATSAFVLLLILSIGGFAFHAPTAIWGSIFGLTLSVSMYAGHKALSSGPISITSMIVAFSVVIPVIYGIGFCDETITPYHVCGFVLLVIAIVCTNMKKGNPAKLENFNRKKWILYICLTFAVNGIGSVLQKAHQQAYPKQYSAEFMLFAMMVCTVVFTILSLLRIKTFKRGLTKSLWFAAMGGVSCGVVNYLTITMAGFENAATLFPTISVGTILGVMLCGRLIFKEKLKWNHYIAIACGIAAVVLLKI